MSRSLTTNPAEKTVAYATVPLLRAPFSTESRTPVMFVNLVRQLARKLGRRVVYGSLALLLVSALAAAAATGSLLLLLVAFLPLVCILAVTVRDVRVNRIMVHQLHWRLREGVSGTQRPQIAESTIKALESRVQELEAEVREAHALLAVELLNRDSSGQASPLETALPRFVDAAVLALLRRKDALDAYSVAARSGRLTKLRLGTLRLLRNELRKRGYLTKALEVARAIRTDDADDRDVIARRHIQGEIAVMSGEFVPTVRPESPGYKPRPGRVLHLVGRSLPADQVGYTLRTHYIATAQLAAGIEAHVATQMGYAHEGDDYASELIDGVTYHRIPGPRRGQVRFDAWMRMHVQRAANLVRVVRPAVLHAASDFINAQTAIAVGREFGIPVIYESRGFWEETWLSRTAEQYRWHLPELEATHGLPEIYLWRREIEDGSRRDADYVVTLDPVMAERIAAGGVPPDRISVVPNGVAVEEFPVLDRNAELALRLGISEDAIVIGYISSLVEYEGIDILISAYAEMRRRSPEKSVALLVVGDGPVREGLVQRAQACGLNDVIFTGQVPHDQVIDYYSIIDIFVVPRRPVEVCQLVTPLKPFEAFSTGRTVVLSNVRALQAIAKQSGAAELFEAGDRDSLADVLISLVGDPERRRRLSAAGAAWVRAERTWQSNVTAYIDLYQRVARDNFGPTTLVADGIAAHNTRQSEGKAIAGAIATSLDRGDLLGAYELVTGSSTRVVRKSQLRRVRDELESQGQVARAYDVALKVGELEENTKDRASRRRLERALLGLRAEWVKRVDLLSLRSALTDREPLPYERFSSADSHGDPGEIMDIAWTCKPHPPVKISLPVDWLTLCMSNRSWNFALHSWDFMGRVLSEYEGTKSPDLLQWCVDRAVSWSRTFAEGDAHGTMAWYDMAIGLRAARLAFLTEQAILAEVSGETVDELLNCVARHQLEFSAEDVFNEGSNHGFYVALGQLAMARRLRPLPFMDALYEQGERRLRTMASKQFARDGGHVEHSPEYHRMVLSSFRAAIEAGLIRDSEVRDRIAQAEDVLGWFIQPNGELVQVGDSFARQMRSRRPRVSSSTTEFLVSKGERGTPDWRRLLLLRDAGYAIVRDPQPVGRDDHELSCYLCLVASFHSRTHKHADDLSLTWFDRGGEILIDSGRYGYVDLLPKTSPLRKEGYFYSSKERQYVEATRAHNTVEADGRDHVRYGRDPYGSGIVDAEERDGHSRVLGEVSHGAWRHRREAILLPGHWLLVNDTVVSQDGLAHDFCAWWNIPGDAAVRAVTSNSVAWELGNGVPLHVREFRGSHLVAPVAGQKDPLRGWRSRRDLELVPSWSFGFKVDSVKSFRFQTVLKLFQDDTLAPPSSPFESSRSSELA